MKALWSFLAVLALVLIGLEANRSVAAVNLLTRVVPYAALLVFLAGFCYRVVRWAWTPVPFRIPTTCGQQKSLPWIKQAKIENPSSAWGVLARMAGEILLFRSLFRNHRARVRDQRLVFSESGLLWCMSLAFHWALLLILLRHLRLFVEPVPAFVNTLERLDGCLQFATPQIYLSDIALLAALAYLLLRRFRDSAVRFISLFSDYFALILLLAIGITGVLMRYFVRVDVFSVKQLAMSIASFHLATLLTLSPLFLAHLFLVCALAVYLPFSKLMHMGGVFLSPTRNLANNNRSRRHINQWNAPVKTHTYAEWEEEFHDKLVSAGIPLEEANAGPHSN
jgi:nitrate reductase gamma subunit